MKVVTAANSRLASAYLWNFLILGHPLSTPTPFHQISWGKVQASKVV